ncbi:MAG TPA: PAS domain S-box protein [Bacteroidia bacterium]|nr:PAS domain S-box protein [Bacteroidia bacterium]
MKILFLEEKQSEIKLYEGILEDALIEFEGRAAKTENEFIRHVNHFHPDIIISGYSLSKYSVNEALKYLEDQSLLIPFVFITGSISEQMARSYIQKGVDDYVPKSNLFHLPVVIQNAIAKKAAEKSSYESDLLRQISEGKLQVIFDNNPDCMFEIGFHGELIKMNPAAIRLIEIESPVKLKKATIWSFLDKTYFKKFRSQHEGVCRGNKREFTFKFISSKGNIHFIEATDVPLFNSEKQVTSTLLIGRNMTEKIKTEKELQITRSDFNALIENIPNNVWSVDRQYRLITFNNYYREVFEKTFGAEPKPGDSFDKYIPEAQLAEFRMKWMEYFNRALNGEHFSIETDSIVSRENTYSQISFNPIHSGNEITGISCISVDITPLKKINEQLKTSEELFRNLIENSPIGIYQTDVNGNCTFVNKKWCELTGLTQEEAAGKGWVNALHPEDKERIYEHWNDAAKYKQVFRDEYRYLSRNKKEIWVSVNAVINKDANGKITGYIGTVEDITEIKKKESERSEAEKNFYYIFDNSPDVIYIEDETGTVLNANKEACRFEGLSREELIGMNILDLVPKEKGKEIMENHLKLFREDRSKVKSTTWNKNGKEIPVEITSRRIIFDNKPALLLQERAILNN